MRFPLTGDGKRPGIEKYEPGRPDCSGCRGERWGMAPHLINGKLWCPTHRPKETT